MVWEWLVGFRRGGPVCLGVRLVGVRTIVLGCGACAWCPGMFGFLVWLGVVGGMPRLRVFRSRLWVTVGRWLGNVGVWVCVGAL